MACQLPGQEAMHSLSGSSPNPCLHSTAAGWGWSLDPSGRARAGGGRSDSLGQDAGALGLGEVLQLQGVLGEESHGQVEIVVPKLQ